MPLALSTAVTRRLEDLLMGPANALAPPRVPPWWEGGSSAMPGESGGAHGKAGPPPSLPSVGTRTRARAHRHLPSGVPTPYMHLPVHTPMNICGHHATLLLAHSTPPTSACPD